MKLKYDLQNHKFHIGEHYDYYNKEYTNTFYTMRRWGNVLAECQPRYGKSSLAKDLATKISKKRKLIIFDYHGEWINHVTQYNMDADFPDKIINIKELKNFTFNILDFTNVSDFKSMGFNEHQSKIVCDIVNESKNYHKGEINVINEVLSNLPVRSGQHFNYNNKYGTKLLDRINTSTKASILTWWKTLSKYFWQGPLDTRNVYNFGEELMNNDHLIINLEVKDMEIAKYIAKTYVGKLLEQLKHIWVKAKPFIIVEETRMLFPSNTDRTQYSSNIQMYNVVTHGPKLGVCTLFLVQHRNQIYQPILENIHQKFIGVVQKPEAGLPEYSIKLNYNPERGIREFLYIDVNSTINNFKYTRFSPCVPCVEYRSDQ